MHLRSSAGFDAVDRLIADVEETLIEGRHLGDGVPVLYTIVDDIPTQQLGLRKAIADLEACLPVSEPAKAARFEWVMGMCLDVLEELAKRLKRIESLADGLMPLHADIPE